MIEDVATRVQRLRSELERERDHYLVLGRYNYCWQITLMLLTVGSSALAAVLGLGLKVDPRIVGGIALIPGICAGIASQFRVEGKTDWHYRKYDALKALLRQLNYVTPINPSAEEVAGIAATLTKIEAEMTAAWEKTLEFSFEQKKTAKAAAV